MKSETILAAILAVGLSAAGMALAAGPAQASTYTWDNGGGDMAWATANNWDVGGNPATPPTATDTAAFTGTAPGTVTAAGTVGVGNVQFTASGYTITSGALSLGGTAPQIQQTAVVTGTNAISSGIGLQTATNGLTVDVAGGTLYLNGLLTGFSGGLTKTGSGTVILANAGTANNYSGATTVSGGTLQLGAADQLPNAGALNVNGATFNRGGFNDQVASLSLNNGTVIGGGALMSTSNTITGTGSSNLSGGSLAIANAASTATFAVTNSGDTLRIDDLIYNSNHPTTAMTFYKTGAGTLILTNSGNIFPRGNTGLIQGGTLKCLPGYDNVFGQTALQVLAGATWDINGTFQKTSGLGSNGYLRLAGGTIDLYNYGFTWTGTNDGTGTLIVGTGMMPGDPGGPQTFSNPTPSVFNTFILSTTASPTGAGRAIGTGTVTATGGVRLEAGGLGVNLAGSASVLKTTTGTVLLSAANKLPSAAPLTIDNGVLNLQTFAQTVPTLSMTGGTLAGTGAGILTLGNSADVQAGMITAQLSGGTVQKSTGGTVTLSAAGVLSNSALVINGGVLNSQNYNQQVPTLTMTGGTISGAGILTLGAGTITSTGTSRITGGNLYLGAGMQRTINVTSGTLTIDSQTSNDGGVTNTAPGRGPTFVKNGAGTLILTNSTNMVGCGAGHDNIINAGTVISGASYVLGGDTKDFNMPAMMVNATASWDLSGHYQTVHNLGGAGTVNLNGGTLRIGGDYPNTFSGMLLDTPGTGVFMMNMGHTSGGNTDTEAISGAATAGHFVLASGNLTGAGSMTAGDVDLQRGTLGLALLGSGAITKSTMGTVLLNAANRFSGSGPLTVADGVLNLQTFAQTVPTLSMTGGTLAGSSTVTVATSIDARSGLIAANLIGPAGLTKSTGGTVILTGTNTYGGDTAVSAGELRVNGSVQSAVTVNPGGAIGGSGSLGGGLMLSGGTLEPGNNGVGILTVTGPATLQGGSTYEWQLSSATSAGQQDLLATTGSLNLTAFSGNPMTIDITSLGMSDFSDAANYQWVIASSAAEINGFDASGYVFTVSGFSSMPTGAFSLSTNGDSDLVLSYTAPEPATLSLLVLGGLAILRRRRWNRK